MNNSCQLLTSNDNNNSKLFTIKYKQSNTQYESRSAANIYNNWQ